jgi:hypothetical protein
VEKSFLADRVCLGRGARPGFGSKTLADFINCAWNDRAFALSQTNTLLSFAWFARHRALRTTSKKTCKSCAGPIATQDEGMNGNALPGEKEISPACLAQLQRYGG